MSGEMLFPDSIEELLISVYVKQDRTLDDLPYTPQFEALYDAAASPEMDRAGLFHQLHNLRKSGRLPRLGRASEAAPRIAPEQEELLRRQVEAAIGKLSLRDQLPYSSLFAQLVARFNADAGLNLSNHDVWRLIAKLAKAARPGSAEPGDSEGLTSLDDGSDELPHPPGERS